MEDRATLRSDPSVVQSSGRTTSKDAVLFLVLLET
jgi:hypothetical protein